MHTQIGVKSKFLYSLLVLIQLIKLTLMELVAHETENLKHMTMRYLAVRQIGHPTYSNLINKNSLWVFIFYSFYKIVLPNSLCIQNPHQN